MTIQTLTLAVASLMLTAADASAQVVAPDAKIVPGDGQQFDFFGRAVALGGGKLAVGAYLDDDRAVGAGSVYVFDAATGALEHKLVASDGGRGDRLGLSVAVGDGLVVAGAPLADASGTDAGAAYVFDIASGAELARLTASDGAAGDRFGMSVAVGGGVIAVGADSTGDNGVWSGAAYLFDAATGSQLAKLLPDDGAPAGYFGTSIGIDGGRVVVGAVNAAGEGSAYLFDLGGRQLAALDPVGGEFDDHFGSAVGIDGGVVAVGAYHANDFGQWSGAAYLFDAATGAQLHRLVPSDGAELDYFGQSIAIDGGLVAVGSYWDTDNGIDAGSAYVFDVATGRQVAKLLPRDGSEADEFTRFAIAIEGVTVAGGAHRDDDNGGDSGSAYVFTLGCLPDINRDGSLDSADFGEFLDGWLRGEARSDWSVDGVRDTRDIVAYLEAWAAGC